MNGFIVSTGSGNKVISSDNGSRSKVSRKGSRKGYTSVDGKSPMEVLKMLEYMQEFPEQREIISSGDENAAEKYLRESAGFNGWTYEEELRDIIEEYEEFIREGSRKGDRDIVQEIIDQFDEDEINHDKLIALAKELPQGKGEDVIIALGVGAWRGDEPEEEEFFRIIDSKFDRSRTGQRKCSRKGSRRGSRKGEAVYDSSDYQEIIQYMKDHSTQEILDTKFPNADAGQIYDAFEEGISESDWFSTVFPTLVREGDAESKMKQACQSAGIDSSMSSDDWYNYQEKHNLSSMWSEGSPLTVYNHYISKGIEKVFGCKPDKYDTGFTSISQTFIDDYERISKPELTEEEKHKAFLGYMSTFNSNVDGDAIWRDIKDSPVKKGEEIRIYDMIQAMTSDPHYGDKYFK